MKMVRNRVCFLLNIPLTEGKAWDFSQVETVEYKPQASITSSL